MGFTRTLNPTSEAPSSLVDGCYGFEDAGSLVLTK